MRQVVRAIPALLFTFIAGPLAAQGKAITPADIKAFNTVRQMTVSNDGKYLTYVTGLADSNTTMILRGTGRNDAETRVNVGNGGGSMVFSGDSKWFAYVSAPPRAPGARGANGRAGAGNAPGRGAGGGTNPGRGGGNGRGTGGGATTPPAADAAAAQTPAAAPAAAWKTVLMNLATKEKREYEGVRRFYFTSEKPTFAVLQGDGGTGATPGTGRGGAGINGAAGTAGSADLYLLNLATNERTNLGRMNQYAFQKDGDLLVYTMDSPDKLSNGIYIRDLKSNAAPRALEMSPVTYSGLTWVDSSRALSVTKMVIDSAAKDTSYTFSVYRNVSFAGTPTQKSFSTAGRKDIPTGFIINPSVRYSEDYSKLFLTLREKPKTPAPGRGSPLIVPGAPGAGGQGTPGPAQGGRGPVTPPATPPAVDSSVSLILWHYKDTRLQSQQILSETADRTVTMQAVYHVGSDKIVPLTDTTFKSVSVTRGDKLAYSIDTRAYDERASYTGRTWQDVYRVDLETGKRTLLQKKRWPGATSVAPDGRRMAFWGPDENWWILDLVTGDSVNITKGVPAVFADLEDDHNNLHHPAAGVRGWSTDGKWLLISDDWDIWKVATTPAPATAVNLTGNGKKDQIRYQGIVRFASANPPNAAEGIDLSQPLLFTTYGEWTKKEGMSRVEAGKPGATVLFFDDYKMTPTKARDADVFYFTKSSFTQYPDWYLSGPTFKDAFKITDANPQLKDLAWSSGTQLINYSPSAGTQKGTKLQAAIYLPANYQPGKKYPMLVTIYEKRSQGKNAFVLPSESRAPDPSLYTSRGYIVMDPDIVYTLNDPGMSAVWCLLPAVKAAIATGMVDEKHIGLWGHSWGGYQTAFMVTQTNVFAAAIAGAPLTNMVSMYASVYWNSGGSDAAIFESSQGRFKGNVVENVAAYTRNSPAYFADKMNTPLIILHNDKDGAVDFNQGITYYNTLRQLGKPVIMLEYAGENHGLARQPNLKDYALRMSEFFDHYLKGAKAPDWLENGIPRVKMTEHLAARNDTTTKVVAGTDTVTTKAGGGN